MIVVAGGPVRSERVRHRVLVNQAIITMVALSAWASVIAIGRAEGLALLAAGRKIVLPTPPVLGDYRDAVPSGLWVPVLVAVLLIVAMPIASRRLSWRALAPLATASAVGWWLSLALVDGIEKLTHGVDWETDYQPVMPRVANDPLGFLRSYVDNLPSFQVQLRGHPPGFTMLLGVLDRFGLQGPGWTTGLVLVSAAASVPALLLIVHRLAGDHMARRALPFIVVSPAALWIATSVDAFYLGITTWMIALLVLALDRPEGAPHRRGDLLAVAAGLLAAVTLTMSYGLVLLAAGPLFLAWHRRRFRPVLIAGGVALAGVGVMAALGFWWVGGLLATRQAYLTLELDRPYSYFFVNNLAAWALALGPAVVVALTRLRDRRLWLLVGGGIAAVVLANLSGMSEGEVERIWLPFTILVIPAAAALATGPWVNRFWLAAQAGSALALTALINLRW